MLLTGIFSTLIDGVIDGSDAHWITFRDLLPISEIFFNMIGRLWIILTGFPGPLISPFLIILIPLLAVHEKPPLIGLIAYVYHSLPTNRPCFVFFIISSCELSPEQILRLCGAETGIGSEFLPNGDPILNPLPVDSFSCL